LQDVQPLGVDYESLSRHGVLAYCPICDGFDHSNKNISVLIDSVQGFHKVQFLSHFSKILQAVVIRKFPISNRWQSELRRLKVRLYQGDLKKLQYDRRRKRLFIYLKDRPPIESDIAYVELGSQVPLHAVQHLKGLRKSHEGRFFVSRHQQTSIPGLYAIGDCANTLAQVSVAVGEAAIAATDVHNQLSRISRRRGDS
jgi:thioredoxin reductase (NADPH)